jgi:RNA polymerase sigma-70 factor (ECF subfamily)
VDWRSRTDMTRNAERSASPSASPPADLPPMGERSDRALVDSVVRHEIDAYTELRRRHLRSVTAVARMLLGGQASCEDVVAEVFVAFWLSPEQFDPERGSLLAFLRLKCRGRSIDVLRAEASRTRREFGRGIEVGASEIDAGMLTAEAAGSVRAALLLLPADERVPIELAFFIGMAYGTVALHLHLPEGTVKSRIRRGLRRMEATEGLQQLRSPRGGSRRTVRAACRERRSP